MKSITKLAEILGCSPILINNILIESEILVRTEFNINDGFIDDEIYDSIVYNYNFYNESLFDSETIKSLKQTYLPISKECFVYFLFDKNEIVYIGQSIQILGRIQDHIQNKKIFDSVALVVTEKKKLLIYESFYIYKLKPKYNCIGDKEDNFIRNLIRISQ